MKLDTANRSFFALLALVVVPYALLGLVGCGLLSLIVYRLATGGLGGLEEGGQDLRPAVVFFGLLSSGTVVAAFSVRRQLRATARLARTVGSKSATVGGALASAADRAGLSGRVVLWDEPTPCSFTYGVLRPKVAVSRGLLDAIDDEELAAVLHHEQYHVRNFDTVKVVVARAAASAFFFLPALCTLRDRYLAGRELAADRRAVRAVGERSLAGALFKVIPTPADVELGAAAALGASDFLDQRVEQLERGIEPHLGSLSLGTIAASAAGLLVLTGALVLTVVNGGPSPMTMDRSDEMGAGFAASVVVGSVVCTGGWAAVAVYLRRRSRRLPPA